MSIVDALLRAKQMGQERTDVVDRKERTQESNTPLSPAEVVAAARKIADTNTSGLTVPEGGDAPMRLERLTVDVGVCTKHHIIAPEIDETMGKKASPPYRMLRAQFLQRCRAKKWSTLAITSPGPGEGKSVTAMNLAISIAREGNYDVFLLDLDMRNPSVCRYLGVSPKREIVAYFNGDIPVDEAFFSVGIKNLTIAGGVTNTTHASELLANGKLEQMLAYIKRVTRSPLILIDLPPVVNTDDALVAMPHVDAALLVVSEGHTRRDSLDRAVELLTDFNVAGVILNQTTESIASGYHGD